jgi:hypothetical protein
MMDRVIGCVEANPGVLHVVTPVDADIRALLEVGRRARCMSRSSWRGEKHDPGQHESEDRPERQSPLKS